LSSHFFTDLTQHFFPHKKHSELGFPYLSQDAVFSDHAHMVIVATLLRGECEDETHTPKMEIWESSETLEFSKFDCEGQKSLPWRILYIIRNFNEVYMSKMGSHDPFGHLQHKLRPKERPGVKLAVWLPTTESRESTRFPCM
jgi:hypothetical protein